MAPKESAPDPPNIAQSFKQFSKLPAEIRCKIWTLALVPRIIHLGLNVERTQLLSLTPVQGELLITCQESRAVFQKVYTKSASIRQDTSGIETMVENRRDTLYFALEATFVKMLEDHFDPQEAELVQHTAVDLHPTTRFMFDDPDFNSLSSRESPTLARLLRVFRNLETLTCVVAGIHSATSNHLLVAVEPRSYSMAKIVSWVLNSFCFSAEYYLAYCRGGTPVPVKELEQEHANDSSLKLPEINYKIIVSPGRDMELDEQTIEKLPQSLGPLAPFNGDTWEKVQAIILPPVFNGGHNCMDDFFIT